MPESLEIGGTVTVNGTQVSSSIFRSLTSYVEQEDALIGSLTVRETLDFAARLSLPGTVSKRERLRRVDELLSAFGLQEQAHVIVGTPIRRGISGGQKRRLGIASQLITGPKVLFLDEPTSGLDSKASFEVVRYLKNVTRTHKLLVVASIHQPSTSTFELFDKLLLLSSGLTCYFGSVGSIKNYMVARGSPLPLYINPAEFLLDLTSTDFSQHDESAKNDTQKFIKDWQTSASAEALRAAIASLPALKEGEIALPESTGRTSFFNLVLTLLHRSFIKSYRDIVAYGIRSVMYIGLAVMMGTVWLRLPETQSSIGPFTNAIFFGSAFMSFMAVAYVPAFLEDRATFIKERANGLYGATAFMLSNFLIGLPYLCKTPC
ncbi:MAG: hypothetical protein LQ342_006079 [Letrouitia transgressa]|nr:MAG: hypothetical protein LQ342_006079 [Letrouitia transgressa]